MLLRLLAPFAGALVLLLSVGAVSASAHVELVSTSPKSHSTRSSSPGSVSMTFSGPLRRGTLAVANASGRTVSSGRGGRDPRNINRLLVSVHGLKAGKYTVKGSTVSADGHAQTWSFWFRVK
jgi:methionine-rich copper-binding protein CopC